jgi:uncharacterized protein
MKQPRLGFCFAGLCLSLLATEPLVAADPVRVLLMVGGHDYQTNQFHRMFEQNPAISLRVVEHPAAHAWWRPEHADAYDVIVLYDMWQPITEEAKADLLARLEQGKGLVALHHSLASYQAWDTYREIIGGRYHLKPRVVEGTELPGSTYRHHVKFRVQVLDRNHFITRGLDDFDIHDETYGGLELLPNVNPLLGTSEPTSSPTLAWHQTYRNARVVTIQLGHDGMAYENPNYAQLVGQTIRWAARRE